MEICHKVLTYLKDPELLVPDPDLVSHADQAKPPHGAYLYVEDQDFYLKISSNYDEFLLDLCDDDAVNTQPPNLDLFDSD